ncbi:MAG: hypothetical protein SFY68_03800 [Candidatus Sumerlaeia bacterium]|nr:hypothetical protein [Candidatus Sumerlaeia bacterium]
MNKLFFTTCFALLCGVAPFAELSAQTLPNSFTYQGTLVNDGVPANGNYNFEFLLYTAATGGTQIGATQSAVNVPVSNGFFTLALDFGSDPFKGDRRFLEIRSAPTGTPLSLLAPRLELRAQPYALYAKESGSTATLETTSGDLVFSNGSRTNLSNLRVNSLASETGEEILKVTSDEGAVAIGDTATDARFKVRGIDGIALLLDVVDDNDEPAFVVDFDRKVGINIAPSTTDRVRIQAESTDTTALRILDNSNNVMVEVDRDGDFEVFDSTNNPNAVLMQVSSSTGNTGIGRSAYDDTQFNIRGSSGDSYFLNVENSSGDDLFSVRPSFGVSVQGNFNVTNGSKNFLIDHPQNPDTQWLSHNAVEGPGYYTHYQGTVTLNAEGRAEVALPAYFESLNGGTGASIHYQLTPIGAAMPQLHISREVKGNSFEIAGGAAGAKVSWLVNAERRDPYALAHPYEAETEKSSREKGYFAYPQGYGATAEKGVGSIPQQGESN